MLAASHLITGGISLRLDTLNTHQHLAAAAVKLENVVEDIADGWITTPHQGGAAAGGVLPETLEIDHLPVWETGFEAPEPAVVVGENSEGDYP